MICWIVMLFEECKKKLTKIKEKWKKYPREVSLEMHWNFVCDFTSLYSCLNRNGKYQWENTVISHMMFSKPISNFEIMAFEADQ